MVGGIGGYILKAGRSKGPGSGGDGAEDINLRTCHSCGIACIDEVRRGKSSCATWLRIP